jgi:hypothetical protein
MANHISVCNVDPYLQNASAISVWCSTDGSLYYVLNPPTIYLIEFLAQDGVPRLLRDFHGLHLRLDIEGDAGIAGNLLVFFQVLVEVTRPIPVPEKSDVPKLDRLTARSSYDSIVTRQSINIKAQQFSPASVGADAVARQVLAGRPLDLRGSNEVVARELELAVVLEHAGVPRPGEPDAVEPVEALVLQRLGEHHHPVGPEVERHHGVSVPHRADRLPAPVDYDEGG